MATKPAKRKKPKRRLSMKGRPAKKKPGKKRRASAPRKKARPILEKGFRITRRREPPSGAQAGDLQGLSDAERADSESVDELLEAGNAFEAGVVEGVQDAEDSNEREVRTREVPEDDVPEEYLGEDRVK